MGKETSDMHRYPPAAHNSDTAGSPKILVPVDLEVIALFRATGGMWNCAPFVLVPQTES